MKKSEGRVGETENIVFTKAESHKKKKKGLRSPSEKLERERGTRLSCKSHYLIWGTGVRGQPTEGLLS